MVSPLLSELPAGQATAAQQTAKSDQMTFEAKPARTDSAETNDNYN